MKKYLPLLLLFLALIGLSRPTSSSAQVMGPNMSSDFTYPGVQTQMKNSYGGSVPVATLLIDISGCGGDLNCYINKLNPQKTAINNAAVETPILRLFNQGRFILDTDARILGQAMAQVFPGQYVVFFNEVNNPVAEWQGVRRELVVFSYRNALRAFIEGTGGGVKVLPAALDPVFTSPSGYEADDFIRFVYDGSISGITGLVFNVYQRGDWTSPCPATPDKSSRESRCSWLWLLQEYQAAGLISDTLILTEYSLYPPTDDTDLARVIQFIDATKGEMGSRGIDYITPLIRNPCGAIQGGNNWPWLLFVNGNPSRILEPNAGTDLSDGTCAGGSGIGLSGICDPSAPPPQQSGITSTIGTIFNRLLSFFFPPPLAPPAKCESTTQKLTHTLADGNRGRMINLPTDCHDPKLTQPVIYRATLNHTFTWTLSSIIQTLIGGPDRGSRFGNWAYQLLVDTSSPNNLTANDVVNRDTFRDYLWGAYTDPKAMEERIINCSGGACGNREIYKYSGAIPKLMPFLGKSPTSGGIWKKRVDADRDTVLCQIVSGYKLAILQSPGSLEADQEYTAGYVHGIEGTSDTCVTATPFTTPTRPLYGIEFVCTNPNFDCPGSPRGEINQICSQVMGPYYSQGEISPGSILAVNQKLAPAQLTLRTPSEQCLYAARIDGGRRGFHLLPSVINSDRIGRVCERIIRDPLDPLCNPNDPTCDPNNPNPSSNPDFRCDDISLPVGGSEATTKKVFQVFAPPQQQAKIDAPTEIKTFDSNTCAVTGDHPAVFGGSVLDRIAYWLGFKTPPVLGVASSQGQVLQAAVPSPSPSPSPTAQQGVTRTIETLVYLPEAAHKTMRYTSGKEGYCMNFMNHNIASVLRTPINGVPPAEFPTRANIAFQGNNISGSTDTPLPEMGGPIIVCDENLGILTEMIMPYDPNKIASTSRMIHQMAQKAKAHQDLSQNPWQKLASFKNDPDQAGLPTQTGLVIEKLQ